MFIFLAFLLMGLASYFSVARIVQQEIYSNAEKVLSTAEAIVNLKFREMEIALFSLGQSMQNRLAMRESHEQIETYLTELTHRLSEESSDGIAGFLGLYGFFGGEFFNGSEWTPPRDYDPTERPWYAAALEAGGEVAFTTPYVDVRSGRVIISASMVLQNPRGIVALDLDTVGISRYVASLQSAEGGYGMLIGRDMTLIAHPDEEYFGKPFEQFSEAHSDIARSMKAGENVIPVRHLQTAYRAEVVAFFRRIRNGWYLGIATPVGNYYRDVHLMAAIQILLGSVFMVVLSYFLVRLSIDRMRSDEENRSKSSFLARMSHEIRTPLNSILGMSELVMQKSLSPEVHEYISIIRQSGSSLLSIINDILDFSKIESGQMTMDTRSYFFASLMNDMINVIRVRLMDKDKPLDFFVRVDSDIPAQLIGDNVRLRQIVVNLLTNAIKYTPRGFISLDVEKRVIGAGKIELIFRVSDSGIGIKKEDMNKLFTDFSRLNIEHSHHIEGSGLGLSIANTYCRLMDGRVTVSSEYGEGSVFTATVVQSFENDEKLAVVHRAAQKRVLLYEERALHIQSIVRTMMRLGVRVKRAKSLEDFIEGLKGSYYDHAFISSRHAMECIDALGDYSMQTQLVVMVELGDAFAFRDVGCILLPVYSVSLANALNGVFEHISSRLPNARAHFMAPDAKILIVDDISSNLRVAKELVSHYGATVETCSSGEAAIELVRNNNYDLVFMDHMMPGMDGLEATSRIRDLEKNEVYYTKLPIIALTANALSGQREMFLEKGMDDFLPKPIDMQQLEYILRKWIPEEKQIPMEKDAEEPQTMENSKPLQAKVLDIPGVDTLWGIKNTGGTVEVYCDILRSFCVDADEKGLQIEKSEKDGDIRLYGICVHAVKGAARSIGAFDLGDFAMQLEEAAMNGEREVIRDRTGELLHGLREITEGICAALHEDADADVPDNRAERAALQLETLQVALVGMDIETVNEMLIKYAGMKLSAGTKTAVSEIEQHILMFEYDTAVEKISFFLQRNPAKQETKT
jgi:signal transduction histidine kinase/CheY-like chemotaxis protein